MNFTIELNRKSTKVICVEKGMQEFTYHKIYEGYLISNGIDEVIEIANDYGEWTLNYLKIGEYDHFKKLDEWRQQQIESVL